MATRKTYEVVGTDRMLSKYMKIMVETDHGQVPRRIVFKGNFRTKKKGQYSTSDPALIEAMDKHIARAGARSEFICLREKKIPDSKVDPTPRVVQTSEGEMRFETDIDNPGAVKAVVVQKQRVGGVSTVQGAGKWLRDNVEGVTARDVANKDMVTRLAEKHHIVFVDLKQ